jgi:hypothetical protein
MCDCCGKPKNMTIKDIRPAEPQAEDKKQEKPAAENK